MFLFRGNLKAFFFFSPFSNPFMALIIDVCLKELLFFFFAFFLSISG